MDSLIQKLTENPILCSRSYLVVHIDIKLIAVENRCSCW